MSKIFFFFLHENDDTHMYSPSLENVIPRISYSCTGGRLVHPNKRIAHCKVHRNHCCKAHVSQECEKNLFVILGMF